RETPTTARTRQVIDSDVPTCEVVHSDRRSRSGIYAPTRLSESEQLLVPLDADLKGLADDARENVDGEVPTRRPDHAAVDHGLHSVAWGRGDTGLDAWLTDWNPVPLQPGAGRQRGRGQDHARLGVKRSAAVAVELEQGVRGSGVGGCGFADLADQGKQL